MPLLITTYLITNNVINKLNNEYESLMDKDIRENLFISNKLFLYSNFLNLIDMNNNYSVSKRLLEANSFNRLLTNSIAYYHNKSFNKENILFILSIIISKTVRDYLEDYICNVAVANNLVIGDLRRDLDSLYNDYNNLAPLYKSNLSKVYDKSLLLDYSSYDFIKKVVDDSIHFPLCDRLLESTIKDFRKVYNHKSMLKSHYNHKYPYHVYKKKTIVNIDFLSDKNYGRKSFIDMVEMVEQIAYQRCVEYLDLLK